MTEIETEKKKCFIKHVSINLFNSSIMENIEFNGGLNILSGENGTGKTEILKNIKDNNCKITMSDSSKIDVKSILAINPKRNSELNKVEQVFQQLKGQNQSFDNFVKKNITTKIQDTAFSRYDSVPQLFYYEFVRLIKDGSSQIEKMKIIRNRFNEVINNIFENIQLVTEWNKATGIPNISVKKNNLMIPVENLSCGENEVISLILNLYLLKDTYAFFLIDEPEIHLNWHIEEKLFKYFDWFCNEFSKQMIVATHSRIVFNEKYLDKTHFLYWQNNRIICDEKIPTENRTKIAGELIHLFKIGSFTDTTIFVEDNIHRNIVLTIAEIFDRQIRVVKCDGCNNVKSLYKLSRSEIGWGNTFFLVDGDNMGNPFKGEARFIHLQRYCIENYCLDLDTITTMTSKTESEIKVTILELIKGNKEKVLKKNKYLDFLIEKLDIEDITDEKLSKFDVSDIMDAFIEKLGFDRNTYYSTYFKKLIESEKFTSIFPSNFVGIFVNNE